MFQFLAITQAGCRRSFPRHLLHKFTTLTISTVVSLVTQVIYTQPVNAEQSSRPNIVLIMADDQGWGDVHDHANPHVQTPTLDKLRADGASFDRFYVSPVCAPTRASLLTGRYHIRTGVHGVTRGMENMRSEETTIAEILKDSGYATGCFGKWHNGRHFPHHPNGQGFDEFIGFCAGHWNNYFDTVLEHNGESLETRGFITDVLTDHALKFIDQHHDQPFFCYIPYNAPHSPWQVPDSFWKKYAELDLPAEARCAYAMVENIDANIARLLERLENHQLSERTIVLFLTDNGPNSDRYNGDMRGRKGSLHEGGVRVPLFVRWPGRIPKEKTIPQIAMHIDLLPTLADLCGVPWQTEFPIDGRSLKPLLLGDSTNWPDRVLCNFRSWAGTMNAMRGAVRSQQYRAVLENPQQGWQLYDMLSDPTQSQNIASAHPKVVKEMSAVYAKVIQEVRPETLKPLPIPVGYPDRARVELPGHEAHLHPSQGEGIRYNGRAGWANDWVDGWISADAYPFWHLEVADSGTYRVSLLYSGPKGTRLSVHCADQTTEESTTDGQAFEVISSPDRIERKEVYERTWGHHDAGTLTLSPGNVTLSVRVHQFFGEESLDLKAVHLERLSAKTGAVE